jgi:hypothetical protein
MSTELLAKRKIQSPWGLELDFEMQNLIKVVMLIILGFLLISISRLMTLKKNGSTKQPAWILYIAATFSMGSAIGQSFSTRQCGTHSWLLPLSRALLILDFSALKPGGHIEIVEMHVIPTSYDNSLPKNSQIQAFYDVLSEVGEGIGIDLAAAQKFHGMLEKAGFEGVTETVFDLPIGGWMLDRRMREVGLFHQFQMTEGLHGVAGWDALKVEAFLAGVRSEMKDPRVRSLYKL